MEEQRYPIKIAARRAGLTPHVIRAWERRYGAVSPKRNPTQRRLYSSDDIDRLVLLRKATTAGHSIGQVANLSNEELLELLEKEEVAPSNQIGRDIDSALAEPQPTSQHYDACLGAIERFDADALESALMQSCIELGQSAFLEQVIVPLMEEIGELWRNGSLRVAQEHIASAVVRNILGNLIAASKVNTNAPKLIVGTPAGQMHEIGALIVALAAASEGWRVTYLGTSLPAEEIAGAAQKTQAKAVALSIVYPEDDVILVQELRRLGRYLPEGVVLFAGGRASKGYSDVLDEVKAISVDDIPSFRTNLQSLRTRQHVG